MSKKLRILLIEDDPASIESAKMQFGKHKLIIVTNIEELSEQPIADIPSKKNTLPYDLVLTDLYIPFGDLPNCSIMDKNEPETLVPVGIVVYSRCLMSHTPCVLITNSDGHRDALGFVCETLYPGRIETGKDFFNRFITRPEWIDTPKGKGKNWMRDIIEWSGYDEIIQQLQPK